MAETEDFGVGTRLKSRWEIFEIHRGGMGEVLIVFDHTLKEAFAAKTFLGDAFVLNSNAQEKFRQESLIWIGLDQHENVAQARFVENIEGRPFVFLEYVSGGDLAGWIGSPRLTQNLPLVLDLVLQLCDGMQHALAKGITAHRDLKPQNCLLTENWLLKVTDFGLAKAVDGLDIREESGSRLASSWLQSRTGFGAGTPPYMAPEQFLDSKHVDHRADIYATGVLLFELLTGKLPFFGKTWEDFQTLHLRANFPPLTSMFVGAPLVGAINEIIKRCVAKNPDDRYQNFAALRSELASLFRRVTGHDARRAASGTALEAFQLSNKALSLDRLGFRGEALSLYDRALALDPDNEKTWLNKGVLLMRTGRSNDGMRCLDHALALNPSYAYAWANKGAEYAQAGKSQDALACLDKAIKIDPFLEEAWFNRGVALRDLVRNDDALRSYDQATTINPRSSQAWFNKGALLGSLGKIQDELACYERCIDLNRQDDQALTNKGIALAASGQTIEALECLDEALRINPKNGLAWFNKAISLIKPLREFRAAAACLQEAKKLGLDRAKDTLEYCQKQIDSALELGRRGLAARQVGQLQQALEYYDRALDICPHDVGVLINKGAVLSALGDSDSALAAFDHVTRIDPRNPTAWYNKGAILGPSGRLKDALQCFENARRLGHPEAVKGIQRCERLLNR
jgi:tetratricopeptide (TPR) repeat protein